MSDAKLAALNIALSTKTYSEILNWSRFNGCVYKFNNALFVTFI